VAWPTSLPITKLRVLCDRTGGYGGGYAYIDGTGAGTPAVSATPATARANPYATFAAAVTGMRAWNNSNKSHNDIGGGTIRYIDNAGADKTYTYNEDCPEFTAANTWCNVEPDPTNTGVITLTGNGVKQQADGIRLRSGLKLASNAGSTYTLIGFDHSRGMICLDGITVDNTDDKQILTWFDTKYLLNLTLTGGVAVVFNGTKSTNTNIASMVGLVLGTAGSVPYEQSKVVIGSVLNGLGGYTIFTEPYATGDGDAGRIIYNNNLFEINLENTSAKTIGSGFALIQNMVERNGTICFNVFPDGDLTTITNIVEMHNTGVGERCNHLYNDVVATQVVPSGVKKIIASKFNIWDDYNYKGDTFNTGAGSVGAFANSYQVGNSGNVSLFGAIGRDPADAPHNDNVASPYLGNAWLTTSEYNLGRVALGFSQAQIMAMFTSYTTSPQGSPALGGNYQPVSGATYLKSRVPSGKSVLKYDIAGNTRKTDGTGAAGAYEAAP